MTTPNLAVRAQFSSFSQKYHHLSKMQRQLVEQIFDSYDFLKKVLEKKFTPIERSEITMNYFN